jgi:hypothetical protein
MDGWIKFLVFANKILVRVQIELCNSIVRIFKILETITLNTSHKYNINFNSAGQNVKNVLRLYRCCFLPNKYLFCSKK